MYDCKVCHRLHGSRTYVFPPIHDFQAKVEVQVQVSVEIGAGAIVQIQTFVEVDELAPDC